MCVCGVSIRAKRLRVYDLDAKEFFVSRDVKFIEDVFPFSSLDNVNIEFNADSVGEIHEDFADLGVCDEDCGVELHSCDQRGEGTSREHGNHRNSQQLIPSSQPLGAAIPTSTAAQLSDHPAPFAQQLQPTQMATQLDSCSNAQQPIEALADLPQSTENMGRGFRTKYPSGKSFVTMSLTLFLLVVHPTRLQFLIILQVLRILLHIIYIVIIFL